MLNFNSVFSSAFSCFVAICTVLLRGVSLFKQGSGNFTWTVILLLVLMDSMEGTKALVRSGRTRQPPMTYTPSKTENVTTKVDYTLNTKKALKKKLKATEREWNVRVENKSGTLVLEFTPAPYEVFKQNVKSFYEQSNKKQNPC